MGRRRRLPLFVSDSDWEGWARDRQAQQLVDELEAYDPFTEELIQAMTTPIDPDAPSSGCCQVAMMRGALGRGESGSQASH